jgi:hypothetical protein
MWVKALAVLVVAAAAAAFGFSLASGDQGGNRGSGTSPSSGTSVLTVNPASGSPATAFRFTFTAPDTTGPGGPSGLAYSLGVLGPATRNGCLAARSAVAGPATKGSEVSIVLDPAKLGGNWCPGSYTARVTEIQRPVCSAGEMCPQFIRVVRTVATASFRVSGP